MKKVRIDVVEGSPGRRFWIFETSLQLWEWIIECYRNPTAAVDDVPPGAVELVLRPGGFIEAEWWGCEIMREGPERWRHLNLVRLALSTPSRNASGNVISVALGWVIDTVIPMHDYADENISVLRVDGDIPCEVDLDAVFRDRGIEL